MLNCASVNVEGDEWALRSSLQSTDRLTSAADDVGSLQFLLEGECQEEPKPAPLCCSAAWCKRKVASLVFHSYIYTWKTYGNGTTPTGLRSPAAPLVCDAEAARKHLSASSSRTQQPGRVLAPFGAARGPLICAASPNFCLCRIPRDAAAALQDLWCGMVSAQLRTDSSLQRRFQKILTGDGGRGSTGGLSLWLNYQEKKNTFNCQK